MDKTKFELNQSVKLSVSGEIGVVTGIAIYNNTEPHYRVYYKSADGRAVEDWWYESQLENA